MHCTGGIIPGHENLITIDSCQAAGKGVNISRALDAGGIANCPLVLLGEENRTAYLRELERDFLNPVIFAAPGRIRENITVHASDGSETRVCFPGFCVSGDVWEKIETWLEEEADDETAVTMTGRIPDGISLVRVKELLCRLIQKGVRTVIDSRSFEVSDLMDVKPWLIKPNQEEIAVCLGREPNALPEVYSQAERLHREGIANVMVSMGGKGAVLACGEGLFCAIPPGIKVMSTIGAGDSTIAGFLAAASEGLNAAEILRTAVAYGTAACLTQGTLPPVPDSIRRIRPAVSVTKVR